MTTGGRSALDRMFRPRSVAVVGASSQETKIGGIPVAYLRTLGFTGRVIPVNPNAGEIQGLPAYRDLVSAPGPIDLAIFAVPAAMLEAALEDAIAAGVAAIVVFSSGLAEIGDEGAALQSRLAARAAAAGLRILGPNCLGFMSVAERCFATFSPIVHLGQPVPGKVAIVSQSGAFGAFALTLARRRGIGISHWITTGNEADVGVAECLEWLAGDPGTEVVVGYVEGVRDGPRLRAAFDACRAAGKPVVLAKVGTSDVGAAAAASHTAALAGEDAVFDGVFRQHGVIRGGSIEQVLDIAYAAAVAGPARGRRTGLFTVSGGAGVLMADEAAARGLTVPELTRETQAQVRRLVPFAGTRNPLDITGQMLNVEGAFRKALELMARDGTVDQIVCFLGVAGLHPTLGRMVTEELAAVRALVPDSVLYAVTLSDDAFRAGLELVGVPVFEDPNRAVVAAAALSAYAAHRNRATTPPAEDGAAVAIPACSTEPGALALLRGAGLPVVPFVVVASADAACEGARRFPGPLVAKVVSPDLAHKTEAGGVRLNLNGPEAVRQATQAILDTVAERAPGARIEGVMIAPMLRGVAEAVIGLQDDPVFGPVVMFGMGGVHVEALRDVVFRAAPIDEAEALRMIAEIRAIRLLTHPRGTPPADLAALARLIAQVSRFGAANAGGLKSLDLNPVIVGAEGQGCTIVDALLIGR